MRLCLFTDTLADVNGVSRFIRSIGELALEGGRDLRILTSTRLAPPVQPNILNFGPRFAAAMPRYEHLEFAIPPTGAMLRFTRAAAPDAIHISTPGPVGLAGLRIARRLRVPVLGVYHTDFPAYIDHLFDEPAITLVASASMRAFYRRFTRVFTRSQDYARSLEKLGIPSDRIVRLLPGIRTDQFHPRRRDPRVWDGASVPRDGVKVLYCGRVSVEKNLPFLAGVWRRVRALVPPEAAQLVVIGDGPYLEPMRRALAGSGAYFLGFRHGPELLALYASADLFVFPSTTDTLGQVVMEAQASALPVVVTDQGGPKEVVMDGQTGLVLPAGDPDRWARRIAALIQDASLRQRMGGAARQAVEPQTILASFDHFWSVHEEAIQEKPNPGIRAGAVANFG
jgi:glycosyltransferase involved in cell wall biosynthesis